MRKLLPNSPSMIRIAQSFVWILSPVFIVLAKLRINGEIIPPQRLIFFISALFLVHIGYILRTHQIKSLWTQTPIPNSSPWSYRIPLILGVLGLSLTALLTGKHLQLIGQGHFTPYLYLQSHPFLLWTSCLFLLFLILEQFQGHTLYFLSRELMIFLLSGPLLTGSLEILMGFKVSQESLFIGIISGWITVFILHLHYLKTIFEDELTGYCTTLSLIGLSMGKRLLAIWWILGASLLMIYHIEYAADFWVFLFGFFFLSTPIKCINILKAIPSKTITISDLKKISHQISRLVFTVVTFWVIEHIWYLWIL